MVRPHSIKLISVAFSILFLLLGCKNESKKTEASFEVATPENMVWVAGKTFMQGAKDHDPMALPREKPAHQVQVDGFFIDKTEVTNRQFKAFVEATGYVTVAERDIDWEEMRKSLPPGTPKPHDSILKSGCLIFNRKVNKVSDMVNYGQWWAWEIGANWQHPSGPESSIEGKDDYPVVHVTIEDAMAYCKWANRRLPTEAEWEAAALGTATDFIFTWGNDASVIIQQANTWQGIFPTKNEPLDGHAFIAPVKSYPPNSLGIYDMAGNVWEITSDFFDENYYQKINTELSINPKGASKPYNPSNPYQTEFIIKGGSFLCHDSYCASFRISARMGMASDSGAEHCGFRTVATKEMLQKH